MENSSNSLRAVFVSVGFWRAYTDFMVIKLLLGLRFMPGAYGLMTFNFLEGLLFLGFVACGAMLPTVLETNPMLPKRLVMAFLAFQVAHGLFCCSISASCIPAMIWFVVGLFALRAVDQLTRPAASP